MRTTFAAVTTVMLALGAGAWPLGHDSSVDVQATAQAQVDLVSVLKVEGMT
ncbi:MAG: hypothetical protein AB7L91_02575 [Dehalococcoidia bacterium]